MKRKEWLAIGRVILLYTLYFYTCLILGLRGKYNTLESMTLLNKESQGLGRFWIYKNREEYILLK